MADQPYAPETMGYQKGVGFPKKDPKKAEEFLNKYKQETGQSGLSFTLRSTADPAGQQLAAAIKSEVEKVPGISVELATAHRAEPVHQPRHRRRLRGHAVAQLPGR